MCEVFMLFILNKDWWNDLSNDKRCENGNKLHTYCIHKTVLEAEHYLKTLPRYERSTLSKLRCGSLPLNIETQRFRNEPLETRVCILCSSHKIQDEMHF